MVAHHLSSDLTMNRGGDQNSRCERLDALELEIRSPRRGLRLSVDIREESGKRWLSMVGSPLLLEALVGSAPRSVRPWPDRVIVWPSIFTAGKMQLIPSSPRSSGKEELPLLSLAMWPLPARSSAWFSLWNKCSAP